MIQTGTTITVFTGECYVYEVTANPDELSMTYVQDEETRVEISFGSKEEMLAVAEAMIQAVKNS